MYTYLDYPLLTEIGQLKIAKIVKFDPDCKSVIEKWNVEISLKRALQWHWFGAEVCVGPTLYGVKQVIAREKEMRNLKNGLLSIGSGPNGDDLLVDATTLAVYFWNHETAKNYEERVKSDCTKLYNHLVSLLMHVRNQDYIPWDAFQARDYYSLQKGL
jgi:hypothetical protein